MECWVGKKNCPTLFLNLQNKFVSDWSVALSRQVIHYHSRPGFPYCVYSSTYPTPSRVYHVYATYGSACQYCVPSSLDIKCLQISKAQGSSVRFLQAPSIIHVVNDRIISILLTIRSILITRRIYLSCGSNILEQCQRYI